MVGVWMRTEPPSRGREPPDLDGFEARGGEWFLRLDYYRDFVSRVAGVELTVDVSPGDLKLIQARLEGCVETYEREGSCCHDDFERYAHVDSIDTVRELTRFFRALVATRVEGAAD